MFFFKYMPMPYKKFFLALLVICTVMLAGFVSSAPNRAKNLKVLPKDISDEKLDSIMLSYNKALGVCCEFCHYKDEKENTDFASDKNPVKEVARNMMRMTIDVNKKYFNTDPKLHPAYLSVVTCNTCHKGDAYPQ